MSNPETAKKKTEQERSLEKESADQEKLKLPDILRAKEKIKKKIDTKTNQGVEVLKSLGSLKEAYKSPNKQETVPGKKDLTLRYEELRAITQKDSPVNAGEAIEKLNALQEIVRDIRAWQENERGEQQTMSNREADISKQLSEIEAKVDSLANRSWLGRLWRRHQQNSLLARQETLLGESIDINDSLRASQQNSFAVSEKISKADSVSHDISQEALTSVLQEITDGNFELRDYLKSPVAISEMDAICIKEQLASQAELISKIHQVKLDPDKMKKYAQLLQPFYNSGGDNLNLDEEILAWRQSPEGFGSYDKKVQEDMAFLVQNMPVPRWLHYSYELAANSMAVQNGTRDRDKALQAFAQAGPDFSEIIEAAKEKEIDSRMHVESLYLSKLNAFGWKAFRQFAESSEIYNQADFDEQEDKLLEKMFGPRAWSGQESPSLSQENLQTLTVLDNPKILPALAIGLEKSLEGYEAGSLSDDYLQTIVSLGGNLSADKRQQIISETPSQFRDLLEAVSNPDSYFHRFTSDIENPRIQAGVLGNIHETIGAVERNLTILSTQGFSNRELKDFFDLRDPADYIGKLKKVADLTGQDKRNLIRESLSLLMAKVDLRDFASLEVLDLLGKELGVSKYDLMVDALPRFDYDLGRDNSILEGMITKKNNDYEPFSLALATRGIGVSPEFQQKLKALYESSDLKEDEATRRDYLHALMLLKKEPNGRLVLESIMSAAEDLPNAEAEITRTMRLLSAAKSFRYLTPNKELRLLDDKEVENRSLANINAGLEKSIAIAVDYAISGSANRWQTLDVIIDSLGGIKEITSPWLGKKVFAYLLTNHSLLASQNREAVMQLVNSETKEKMLANLAKEYPKSFVSFADRTDWRNLLGEKQLSELLGVLPKKTDEKRNAFTHNRFDRTSTFFLSLADKLVDFSLTPENIDTVKDYIEQYGLAKEPLLYKYFANIKNLASGKIESLPADQQADGITSIEELRKRFDRVREIISADVALTDVSNLSRFERSILSQATGYATHTFLSGRPSFDTIIEDFGADFEAGEIREPPPEYRPQSLEISTIEYEFDVDNIRESYELLSREVLAGVDNPQEVESLKNRSLADLDRKLESLQKILAKKTNPYIEKQVAEISSLREQAASAADQEELLRTLLNLDKKSAEKFGLTSVMREIIFRKVLSRDASSNMDELIPKLRGEPSAEGILALINLIDHSVKEHALNMKDQNKEGYWEQSTFDKIKSSKDVNRLVDLGKIFFPYINKLKEERAKFIERVTGLREVRVVPDRGLIGELSGYLANACYTGVYPLLENNPEMVPFKFIAGEGNEVELVGSALAFELTDAEGDKVILMRPFNIPNESQLDVSTFIEEMLDYLEEIGRKRGVARILVPGSPGTISNYDVGKNHILSEYVRDKKPLKLAEKFNFNGYDITNDVFVAREIAGKEPTG